MRPGICRVGERERSAEDFPEFKKSGSPSCRSKRFSIVDTAAQPGVAVLLVGGGGFHAQAGSDHGLQEGHHGAEARAELFDGVLLFGFTLGQEADAAIVVFGDPLLGKAAVLDFGQELFHGFTGFVGDDARASRVVAVFGGIANGVAHVAEATAVDEIDDQFEFVEALEVGDFGLIARFGEGFKAGFDEGADAAAKDGLLAEEVGLGFFGEGGFENAGASAADAASIRERESFGAAGGVLFDGEKAWGAATFGEDFTDTVAGSFGSDHGDVNGGGRLDGAETDVEAVGEHERFAGLKIGRNGLVVELLLLGVRNEDHDDIGPGRGFGGTLYDQTVFFGLGARGAAVVEADADVAAGIAEIKRVSVALRAVAEDRNLLGLDERQVGVLIVIELCHVVPFVGRDAA